jgi:hypothetical protein
MDAGENGRFYKREAFPNNPCISNSFLDRLDARVAHERLNKCRIAMKREDHGFVRSEGALGR